MLRDVVDQAPQQEYYETYWSSAGYRPRFGASAVVKAMLESHVRPGDRVLDFGCGDGHGLGVWLAQRARQYTGVDLSAAAINEARSLGLDAIKIDSEATLPAPDDSYDVAVAHEVLEHLFAPHEAAREILRVLRPGGTLIATVPNIGYWRRRTDGLFGRWNPLGDPLSAAQPWRDPHIRFFNMRALRRMLEQAGFSVDRIGGHEGAFIASLPLLRRFARRRDGGLLYRRLRASAPSLFGLRLNVVAHKPADPAQLAGPAGRRPHHLRPELSSEDGTPAPLWIVALGRASLGGPRPVRAAVRRVAYRWVVGRQPDVLAAYPDGRRYLIPARDRSQARIYLDGEWEPTESDLVRRLLRTGDLAVDVGAHHGWYTLLIADAVGVQGRVVAIEPVPGALSALGANLTRNPALVDRVEIVPVAMGAQRGETAIHVFDGLPPAHASRVDLGRSDHSRHEVPMATLDSMLEERQGLESPAFVKLDVEGGELDVLSGAKSLASSSNAPIWMLEVNHETANAFGYQPADLIEELNRHGEYEVLRVANGHVAAEPAPGSASTGATWLCVPASRAHRLPGLLHSG